MIGSQLQKYLDEQFVDENPNYGKVGREIFKSIKDAYKEKLGYIPLKPMALLHATEQNSDVIKSISCSEPNDLITNIFGQMFSGCINTGADVLRDIVDEAGVTRSIRFQENGNAPNAFATGDGTPAPNLSMGGDLAIGWGDQAGNPWNPTRNDFQLREPFALVPQANFIPIGLPEWIEMDQDAILSGTVFGVSFGGVVGECGMFCNWRQDMNTVGRKFMVSHDKTGLAFSDLDNIKVTYTWSLS